MSRFFLNVVRKSLPRTPLPVLAIPALPPRANSAAYDDWLERAVHVLRAQANLRCLSRMDMVIKLEDSHPRARAQDAIAPVMEALVRAQVLQSGGSPAVRRIAAEWADVMGVEIHLSRVLA
jgi:hypothetical protein